MLYGDLDQALAGMPYGIDVDVDTGLANGAIEFGKPVYALEGDDAGAFPAAGASRHLRGVALRTMVPAASQSGTLSAPGNGTANYPDKSAVNIVVEGKVYVPVAGVVTSGKKAYLTAAEVWTDVVGANIATPYVFRSTTTGAGLALLQVVKSAAALYV